jgi:hypothetical protein
MVLAPEGARFAILRHMFSSPLHLAVMAVAMVAVMAALMMMLQWPLFRQFLEGHHGSGGADRTTDL